MNRLLMLASDKVPITRDYSARLSALSAWDDGYFGGTTGPPQRGSVKIVPQCNRNAHGRHPRSTTLIQ